MRIASVEAIPAGTACYVRITTEDGTSGVGESTFFGWPTAVAEIVRSFEPFLKGKDATDVEHHWLALYRSLSFRGMAISGAISAVDQALWDLRGKRFEVPVWQLLGGRARRAVRAMRVVDTGTLEEVAEAARTAVERRTRRQERLAIGVRDGETFRVSIPSKNKFLVGPVGVERNSTKPIENLRPEHLLEAFLWPEIRNGEEVLLEEFNTDTGRYYVLTVLRGGYRTEILRKVWFDRSDLQVSRLENFAPKGLLMADIQLSDWRATTDTTAAGAAASVPASAGPLANFAHTIGISRPHDDYRLDLQVSKIAINEPIAASRFQLLQPPGSELVQVREANAAKDQKP